MLKTLQQAKFHVTKYVANFNVANCLNRKIKFLARIMCYTVHMPLVLCNRDALASTEKSKVSMLTIRLQDDAIFVFSFNNFCLMHVVNNHSFYKI